MQNILDTESIEMEMREVMEENFKLFGSHIGFSRIGKAFKEK